MKFRLTLAAVLIGVLMVTAAIAAPKPKHSRVRLHGKTVAVQWTAAVVDNQVVITTAAIKHGNRYTDLWTGDGLTYIGTQLQDVTLPSGEIESAYVSQASFAPTVTGTLTCQYQITMNPGRSKAVQWVGIADITVDVTVDDAGVVTINDAAAPPPPDPGTETG